MQLVIASGNPGKLAEFERLLAPMGLACVPQRALGVEDPEETGLTFVENALLKARHASRITGLPALADDSGLCVDALNGAPGLYSARYAGPACDAQANIDKLLDALREVPTERRGARFLACIAMLRHADDPEPVIAEGTWRGRVLDAPRGIGGFGYDPVFLDLESGLSAAEMEPQAKALASHRGRAVRALQARLSEVQWP